MIKLGTYLVTIGYTYILHGDSVNADVDWLLGRKGCIINTVLPAVCQSQRPIKCSDEFQEMSGFRSSEAIQYNPFILFRIIISMASIIPDIYSIAIGSDIFMIKTGTADVPASSQFYLQHYNHGI